MKKPDDRAKKLARIRKRLKRLRIGEIGSGSGRRWIYRPKSETEARELDQLFSGRPIVELGDGGLAIRPEAIRATLSEKLALYEATASETLNASAEYHRRLAKIGDHDVTEGRTVREAVIRACDAFGFEPYAEPEWYALRVLALCRLVRSELADDSVSRTDLASDAMALAALFTEWKTKPQRDREIARGDKAGEWQIKNAEGWRQRAIEQAKQIWASEGKATPLSEVAARIATKVYKSDRAVLEWLKDAADLGLLVIPPKARRPRGRPKKRNA